MREQLCDRRTRLKSFTLSFSEAKKNEKSLSNYGSLLSVDVISTQKQQILFLLMLVCTCMYVCVWGGGGCWGVWEAVCICTLGVC